MMNKEEIKHKYENVFDEEVDYKMLVDTFFAPSERDMYKQALLDIKEYCNNRLDYYNEMRRDYMKEFDGYAENDNENILDIINKALGGEDDD